MLLCIDVGNSHTSLGLFDGERLERHLRVTTEQRRTADEWYVLLRGLLGPDSIESLLTGVAVCSAVPMALPELRSMLQHYLHDTASLVVGAGVRSGVPVHMDNPREVGSDRIANALAASTIFGGPCIVVDLGTATTFDVVTSAGAYVGGAIAPGIATALEALGQRGAQLRRVELVSPRAVIAKNTVEALQSGAVYGFAALVDGIVTRMVAELDVERTEVTVVATGGLAPAVLSACEQVDEHEPALTLIGLRLMFERNR